MAYPESIRKHLPKDLGSCKIRRVNGYYYVYEKRKRTDPLGEKCLGKITEEDGFIPNRYGASLLPKPDESASAVTVKHYGSYETFMQLAPYVNEDLKRFFPQRFREIRTLALLRLIDGIVPHLAHPIFMDSYMSVLCPDIATSEASVRRFVKELGLQTGLTEAFMRASIKPGSQLVFDGTTFFADYHDSLSQKGYNPDHRTTHQVRIVYIFDKSTQRPQFFRVFQGSAVDKTAFIEVIRASGCSNCIILGDKGFYSKKNVSVLMSSDLHLEFVLPLQKNSTLVEAAFYEDPSMKKFDGLFDYKERVVYCRKKAVGKQGNFVYTFYDSERRNHLELKQIRNNETGWDENSIFTDFAALGNNLGYFSFISNMDVSCREIYLIYKERWDIENCFDYLKNVLDVTPVYAHCDETVQGWAFLNHISMLYFYALLHALRTTGLDKKYSPRDVIILTKPICAYQVNSGDYRLSHVQKKTHELLTKLGVDLAAGLPQAAAS